MKNYPHFPGIGGGTALHAGARNLDNLPAFVSYPTAACNFVSATYFPIHAREIATWRMRTSQRAGRTVVSRAALMLEAEMKIAAGRRQRTVEPA